MTEESNAEETPEKILADEIADLDSVGSIESSADESSDDTDADENKADGVDESDESGDKGVVSDESSDEKDETKIEKASGSGTSDADDSKGDEKTEDAKKGASEESQTEESQVDKLLAEINRLSGLVEPAAPAAEKRDKKTDLPETPHDFLTGIDMDDVSSDPQVLNKVLHAVIAKVQQQTSEHILKNLPSEVMEHVNQQMGFKTVVDSFYSDNPDLANVKAVVKACAQQLHTENPDWDMSKIFAASADRTRETLGISKQKAVENNQQVPSADDAAFAKPSGGSKSNQKSQISALQRQIDEL